MNLSPCQNHQAVATGSSDCGLAISDFGPEDSAALNPQSEIRDPQSDDPVATARGSDTIAPQATQSNLKLSPELSRTTSTHFVSHSPPARRIRFEYNLRPSLNR